MKTVNRRTLIYHFDEVNRQGVARLYTRSIWLLTVREWRSPLGMVNLDECKGQYLNISKPEVFSIGFIKEMAAVVENFYKKGVY